MSHNWKKTQFMELALPTTSLQLGLEFTSAVDLIALPWLLSFLTIRFVVRRMYNSLSCHVYTPFSTFDVLESGATVWLPEDFSLRTEVEQILSNITRRKAGLVFGRFHIALYFRNHLLFVSSPIQNPKPSNKCARNTT